MTTKEQLHELLDQLTDEELAELLNILTQRMDAWAEPQPASSTAVRTSRVEMSISGSEFNRMPKIDLAILAERQGVSPITDFEQLLGDFWPDDEDEDFDAVLRDWRDES